MKPKYYAVKSAMWRKAGTVQKRCLVIQLLGTSFGDAGKIEKICVPGRKIIAYIGMSKRGHWVFLWEGSLWIRYPSYELTGKETKWKRNTEAREATKAYFNKRDGKFKHSWRNGRVVGSVHLWGGDTPWGGKGKFALKPFEGELRRSR